MLGYLRQSTAGQSRMVGPFVDDTDFKTVETGLTIANTDVKLSKNGAVGVNKNAGGGTHRDNGMYSFTFDATDTNTVGELSGSILVAGALVVCFKFVVLEEAVYDRLLADGAAGYSTHAATDIVSAGAITTAAGAVSNVTTVATANALGTDAIAAASLSAAAANKQADHIIRRNYNSARLSADGDAVQARALMGAMAKLHNRVDASTNPLTIYHEDDLTAFYTQTMTTDPTADPITGVNTD